MYWRSNNWAQSVRSVRTATRPLAEPNLLPCETHVFCPDTLYLKLSESVRWYVSEGKHGNLGHQFLRLDVILGIRDRCTMSTFRYRFSKPRKISPTRPSAGFARNPNEICFNRRGRGGSQRNANSDSIMNSLRTSASSVVNPAFVVSLVSACILRDPVLFIFLPLYFLSAAESGKGGKR